MTAHRLSWFHLGSLFSLAVSLPGALAGCDITLFDGTCERDGIVYHPGDSFPDNDGCNSCYCNEDGSVACTLMACISGCTYEGVDHAPGASFPASDGCNTCTCDPSGSGNVACTKIGCHACEPGEEIPAGDGCNTCTCDADGNRICTDAYCPETCTYGGASHESGDVFPADDGCNTCTCSVDGKVVCTDAGCPETCAYGGASYEPGGSFPSLDGCNTCTCLAGGDVACTERACACDPKTEWWRSYVGSSPEECTLIDFICPESTAYFQSACGCGCEQDASCPPSFDCMPPEPCDVEAIQQRCPYSGIVY
ncbi:hypothetical protein WMF28_20690 [Sorangium sp. So ce590]|uniref:hypothetical protein n=1 Tax=Sorangium sp. So ce590 TaxID=3133317 RepID=UPI003F6174DD